MNVLTAAVVAGTLEGDEKAVRSNCMSTACMVLRHSPVNVLNHYAQFLCRPSKSTKWLKYCPAKTCSAKTCPQKTKQKNEQKLLTWGRRVFPMRGGTEIVINNFIATVSITQMTC
jgi:hypothetical protein